MRLIDVVPGPGGWYVHVRTAALLVSAGPMPRLKALAEAWGWAEPGDRVEVGG